MTHEIYRIYTCHVDFIRQLKTLEKRLIVYIWDDDDDDAD